MTDSTQTKWYDKTWVVVVLCIFFFPVGLYALWKNNFISKGWKIGVTILIAFLVILQLGNKGKDNQTTIDNSSSAVASEETTESSAKQWTEVYTFKGNGMKKSPLFDLSGNESRLKYKYESQGSIGTGMFAVYVVDEGDDIMKQGGIPEVMIQSEKEESESSLQKSAGRYYLNVNAVGNWSVTVEELK